MKNINFKKIIPGFISIMIVVGMGIQSFATNIDLAAFVNKDKYMTKYYELDWRIDDIDKELNRLYKFVCTNVRTYGGSSDNPAGGYGKYFTTMFTPGSTGGTTIYYTYHKIHADTSQPKYLRLGLGNTVAWSSSLYDSTRTTRKYEFEYPASLMKWREGIEPAPNCMFKMTGQVRGISNQSGYSGEIIMGPFNKIPNITTGGSSKTQGWFCEIPGLIFGTSASNYTLYYAENSKVQPTSWTNTSITMAQNWYMQGGTNSEYPLPTDESRAKDKFGFEQQHNIFYLNAAYNFSNKKDIWIRCYINDSATKLSGFLVSSDMNYSTLTSWNNDK